MGIWKDIPNYEGIYEVSINGSVRTVKGKTTQSTLHGERVWKQRVLKSKTDKKGYKRVVLYKDKKSKQYLIHRLVALAFIPKVKGKEFINHRDGNPSNNHVVNLEWCDHKENLMHAFENRLNKNAHPIILYNTSTKEMHYFISKAEASKFLGRYHGFISKILKEKIKEVDNYLIFEH